MSASAAPAAHVLAVGTALPPHVIAQDDIKTLVYNLFGSTRRDIGRLIAVFDNATIKTRHFAQPLGWFLHDHDFATKNALYVQAALELGEHAAQQALQRAGLQAQDIGALVFVSTTGIATPSLDAVLLKRLGLSRHATRLPIFGLGCAGGAAGLARAQDIAQTTGQPVLLIAAELCSLTFQRHDHSKSNLIATSLFADGAAAVVVGPAPHNTQQTNTRSLELVGGYSTLWDETEDVMGWDVVETGLQVRFSKDVPHLVLTLMQDNIQDAASTHGLRRHDLKHFVTHPGGKKVLAAYAEALQLPEDTLKDSFDVLRHCGNMSSVSVLFVLEKFMQRLATLTPNEAPLGEHGILSAMGPGFSAEHVIFKVA